MNRCSMNTDFPFTSKPIKAHLAGHRIDECAAISNAQAMGIDVSRIDALILSHGHVDHTGGLETFLHQNKKAEMFFSLEI